LSYQNFEQKLKHWHNVPMTIITPSQWLADCVRQSPILQNKSIEVIPNPINTNQFYPLNQAFARQALNLPADKKLLLFGAGDIHDPNKGLVQLISAINLLPDTTNIELVLFGDGTLKPTQVKIPVHNMGRIADMRLLNLLYNAVDAVIVPSRQENLNNTVMEALSCGIPCIAFNIGGMPDMIDHQQNGYLAAPYEVHDLAKGIQWVLSETDTSSLAHHAREKVLNHFGMDVVARQYITVYERVLGESRV
jgi:glycosyltransferase involved in cell wall biosynthesis